MNREAHEGVKEQCNSVSSQFLAKGFSDTDIAGKGKEISTLMRFKFFKLYQIWASRMKRDLSGQEGIYSLIPPERVGTQSMFDREQNMVKGVDILFLISGPEHGEENPISSAIANVIESAQKTVRIASLIFNPADKIRGALHRAKSRRVQVSGNFEGRWWTQMIPSRPNYSLCTEGAVYEYDQKDQIYHKKVLTADDVSVIGSYNLGRKSARCDYEAVCIIKSPEVTRLLNQALEEDQRRSKQVSPSVYLSWGNRLMGTFIAPLLERF